MDTEIRLITLIFFGKIKELFFILKLIRLLKKTTILAYRL